MCQLFVTEIQWVRMREVGGVAEMEIWASDVEGQAAESAFWGGVRVRRKAKRDKR
jgi:hypothetical protein